jgi:hypothetical protein
MRGGAAEYGAISRRLGVRRGWWESLFRFESDENDGRGLNDGSGEKDACCGARFDPTGAMPAGVE